LRILIIVFAALGLTSCFDRGDCLINNTNLIKIRLKKQATNKDTLLAFSSIQVERTKIFLYQAKAEDTLRLPVDITKTSSSFILNYGGIQQKLTFSYLNQTTIPSTECGALTYQTGVTITESTFAETRLRTVNDQLLKNAAVNFEISF
jgi:hypothetical protein